MKSLNHFLNLCEDVTILVNGKTETILTTLELQNFVTAVYGQKFESKGHAKRITGLSYLGGINSSAKIVKGLKKEINTFVLYLKPYKTAFGNVCANGLHCFKPCLTESGRVKMDVKEFKILRARYLKTVLFYVNRDLFNTWLHSEIRTAAKKYGETLMVRLNGTSDLNPVLFGDVLNKFPAIQFYDYTKIPTRRQANNYHLTFSYNGYNDQECNEAIDNGLNVSIVVNGPIPKTFNGVEVFSMDETDVRPLDEHRGKYGYLKLKETLSKQYDTAFIINQNDPRLGY